MSVYRHKADCVLDHQGITIYHLLVHDPWLVVWNAVHGYDNLAVVGGKQRLPPTQIVLVNFFVCLVCLLGSIAYHDKVYCEMLTSEAVVRVLLCATTAPEHEPLPVKWESLKQSVIETAGDTGSFVPQLQKRPRKEGTYPHCDP